MRRFSTILKEISRKLDLPQPDKSRILLEVGSDLEEMFKLYVAEGLSEAEAEKRAGEKFDISDAALAELVNIHQTAINRLLARLSEQARSRWEKALLIVILLTIAVFSVPHLFSDGFFNRIGPYAWPLLGIAITAIILTVRQFYLLFIRKDHGTGKLRSGSAWFIALGCGSVLTGVYGLSVETFKAMRAAPGNIDSAFKGAVNLAINLSAMMMTCLLLSIAIGLIWFFITGRVRRIEEAETEWLFDIR
ncbi:MAG: hypothetical protein JW814_06480 [Candidatus Krumholzibacteriota bacterium]|nr:hypothetical protein [Candidatus Krumholzibacteriota bacterium]